jgi:carbon-monoxide dehydrogenase large subunit
LLLPEGPGLDASAHFAPGGITYGNGAHATVVEVDPETARVRVLRYVVAHDCGTVINPMLVEGQVLGGIAQGIGTALQEQIVYDDGGQLVTASLADYALPRVGLVPTVEVRHRATPSLHNPQGVKGVGEAGTIPVCAALAAAIEDALSPWGVVVDAVPATPARIRAWLAASRGGVPARVR